MPDRGSIESIKIAVAASPSVAALQIEQLLTQLEQTPEPRIRAQLFVEIAAAFQEDLGDEGQAIDALYEAFRIDPTFEPILTRLEPLLHRQQRWAEALNVVRGLATTVKDRAQALIFAETLVRWLTRDVPDPNLAREWVDRIRAIDATHPLVHMMQAALSREHGDHKRELEALDRAVLSSRHADDRARIHLLMASRYREERLYNVAEAKKHYEAAHKLFPKTMEPLRGLEDLAVTEDDKKALAEVLKKQADADVEDAARITIMLRLAGLEEKEFRKPELAAKTLERVVSLDAANESAFDGLERCYRSARAWSELAAVLERGATTARSPSQRNERLKRLGEVLESRLGDVRSAIATYQRLAGMMPTDETVLNELARLAEKGGDVRLAVSTREKLGNLSADPATSARMFVIAGQLLAPLDPAAARASFERAAKADPTNQSAWNALLWDARSESDGSRALGYLEEKAQRAGTPRVRAAAFVELAEAKKRAGDAAGARLAFEAAAEADPSNEAAARALVDALVAERRYADAESLADAAVSASERDKDYERLFAMRRAQALIASHLGNPHKALVASLAAFELKPSSLEAAETFALAAFEMRIDPQIHIARTAMKELSDHSDALSVEARVALADTLVLTGDADRAAVLYDSVLHEQPSHERALAGLSQHHTAQGNPVAALSLKRQLTRQILDPNEKFAAFVQVAEQFSARVQNDDLAAEVYEEARAIRPGDLPVLHKLLGIYQKQQKWTSLLDVLRGIANADADVLRRTKTIYTMAQLAKDELMDRGTALKLFEEALDTDPSHLQAFERIVAMLTEDRDWMGLEQMYNRMLHRALQGTDVVLQHALYKQLGIIHRDRLRHYDHAIECFQHASTLRPEDEEVRSMLTELLARAGQVDSAVAITIDRVLRDPLVPGPYPALFDLLAQQNQRDRALCVASAMGFLGIHHPPAENARNAYPPPPLEAIVMDLGAGGYRHLMHSELDPSLTEIFEVLGPAIVEMATARLSLRDRLSYPGPALKGQDWLASMVMRASAILGAPPPRLALRRTPGSVLTHIAAKPTTLMVYPPSLGGITRGVAVFLVGKRIMEVSPPFLARALVPSTTELKSLVASIARIATNTPEAGDFTLRDRLSKNDVARVAAAVRHSMESGGKLDVARWSRMADVSATRAGLLLAGDLEIARAAIALEPQAPGDPTPREKMKELVTWFLGDTCAALRRALGVAL